jgi:thiamine biosynthesis protein ThiS
VTVAIIVNGAPEGVPESSTIAALIERFEEGEKHLVVERNGRCVFPRDWATLVVEPGDRIEFIHAAFGG